jgi:hypothetical protein
MGCSARNFARTVEDIPMRSLILQTTGGLALAIVLGTSALPAHAHPQPPAPTLDVANPSPGDMLTPGTMIIQGVAYDDNAETGVGVDRVSVFLGDRDEENGAQFLGHAKLGLPNPQAVEGGDVQFAFAGWSVITPPLKATGQERALHVYARSSVSGVEAIEVIPIIMGAGGGAGEEGGGED